MKKLLSMVLALSMTLAAVSSARVFADTTITSVVSGNGAALTDGISSKDGEIKISFAQPMDKNSFTGDTVSLKSITKGTAIDFGEVGEFEAANSATYLFPTTEAFGKGTYWFDFSGAIKNVEMGFMNSVLIYGRSFSENGASSDHYRLWFQRLDAGNNGGYRVCWTANDYNNYVDVSGSSVKSFDLKAKMTLTAQTNEMDIYFNGIKLNSAPIKGSLNGAALADAVSSAIAVFCYTPAGSYDRHIYFNSMKCSKGETQDTAEEIANYDFTALSSLDDLGISFPSVPENTSYLRLTEDAESGEDIAYQGNLSPDGMTYTMKVADINDGASCRLSLSGLRVAMTQTVIDDMVVDFTASDSISSGRLYAHVKAGAGYDLDENPVLFYKNSKIITEFDKEVSADDVKNITVGRCEKSDAVKFKYTAPRTTNQFGYCAMGDSVAHDAGKNVVYEVNVRPYSIGADAGGWFRIYVGANMYQLGYSLIAGQQYFQMYPFGGQLVQSGQWYCFKAVLKPSGIDFYMNGKYIGTEKPDGYDFSGNLKTEHGSYALSNGDLEYDVKNIKVYYEDGSGDLITENFDRNYNKLSSDMYCTVSSIKDEIMITDKISASPVLQPDNRSCVTELGKLQKNADYAVVIDGIDGIVPKTTIFKAAEYLAVDGLFSISGITQADGRLLNEIPYLSSKSADFKINLSGAADESTVTKDTVKLEKFITEDMAYINQTVKNNKTPYGKTVDDKITSHSKTKPVIIELNMIPIAALENSNLYFNITAASPENAGQNGFAQLSYHDNKISFGNAGHTDISDGKMHKIQVKLDADKSYLYVDGIEKSSCESVSCNGEIMISNGFYSVAEQEGTDKLEAYIKDIKVYEEGAENSPIVNHSVQADAFAGMVENAECTIAKDIEYGNTEVDAQIKFENNSISVKPVKAFDYLSNYRVAVTDGLKDISGASVINPVEMDFVAVYSDNIYADNLKLTKTQTGYSGEYRIVNFTDTAASAVVILALYNGNGLLDMTEPKTVAVDANGKSSDNTIVYSSDIALGDNVTAVLYVWENMNNILPVAPITVK